MTTHRNPAQTDEEAGAARPRDGAAEPAPHGDGTPSGPTAGQDRRSDADGVPAQQDARPWRGAWTRPARDAETSAWGPETGAGPAAERSPAARRPGSGDAATGSYPNLRRAVDAHTDPGPVPSGAEDPEDEGPTAAPDAGWRRPEAPAPAAADPAPGAPVPPRRRPEAPAAEAAPEPADAAETAPLGEGTDGRPDASVDEEAAERGASEDPEPLPKRVPHGRHAAPSRRAPAEGGAAGRGDPGDPGDPDNLADWVGSLVGAVTEEDAIAGRRTGPLPRVDADAAEDPGDGEAEPEGDRRGTAAWTPPEEARSEAGDEEEYRPATRESWRPMPATTRAELIARLDALATLVEIGRDNFGPELITRARGLLSHAGARLRLSSDHTVVALAGGTGSGKSSLFNALCGLEFSRVGITRPTTSSAHACVWGVEGADGLLDWLGVPPRHRHSRASELDKGDSDLTGLILLDLPDHDSVRAEHTAEAERLIGSVDLLVWVLDPQKYADAAVHHRYLAEMAGHGAVTVAVLNQVDRVDDEEVEELLTDLRRLLETESGVHPRVLTSSTVTGHGMRDLRELLVETVVERRASIDRLVADLEQVTRDFEAHGDAGGGAAHLPDHARGALVTELAEAAGVSAIADATETAHERRGSGLVGWPVLRWVRRLRRDPLRTMQLDFLREDVKGGLNGPIGVQQAEIDTAVVDAADRAAGELPEPWPKRVRSAARRDIDELPDQLGRAIADAVPDADETPSWWQAVRVWQYLLIAMAGAGLVWLGVLLVSWIGGGMTGVAVLDDPVFIAFAAVVFVATLLVGWLTDVGCRNLVAVAASRQRERVEEQGTERVRAIAAERIAAPMERELGEYQRYCRALAAARTTKTH
ncbi:GTP-binding protein EngB required for normal cell division [Spinactinospora alkalitolerans]|uniref:GTP-binding protein EngB required for normal cell division n=1 Tax=Spinactinospora alkalitolerans TaxID=687207 RepID=A0A852TQN9_9ACTN|nr:YfjP family GTPase [Spinactinospora alkalitolerans]NYE46289.1 GTP-binding protein EngB required for normal cell division [Spinactinospora alkalitolerans]